MKAQSKWDSPQHSDLGRFWSRVLGKEIIEVSFRVWLGLLGEHGLLSGRQDPQYVCCRGVFVDVVTSSFVECHFLSICFGNQSFCLTVSLNASDTMRICHNFNSWAPRRALLSRVSVCDCEVVWEQRRFSVVLGWNGQHFLVLSP